MHAKSKNPEELLAQVPLFAGLDARDRRQLADVCLPKHFPSGSAIVEEGKPGLGLFIITSGRVEVYRGQGEKRQLVNTLGAGGILGEMALIDNQPRSATVLTVEPTECLLITRDSFHTLVQKHTRIAWCIVPILVDKFRRVEGKLLQLMDAAGAADAETPDQAADATTEKPEQQETPGRNTERLLDALRAEYALLLAGTEALSRGAGVMETFFRSLARDTELSEQTRLDPLLRALPKAMRNAMTDALKEGEKLPERMVSTFRRELRRR
jgi:CRP/FNR family cyclic AMP-dependent transcriptional regulator